MPKFRKKPVAVEASQWLGHGDHEKVSKYSLPWNRLPFICEKCNYWSEHHGSVKTLEGEHIVCPGDWIITGVKGEHYPCKPDIFQETYELVEDQSNLEGVQPC